MSDMSRQKLIDEKIAIQKAFAAEKSIVPSSMSKKAADVIEIVCKYLDKNPYYYPEKFSEKFWSGVNRDDYSNAELLDGHRKEVLEYFLSQTEIERLLRIWNTRGDFIYQEGYLRRSFRSKKNMYLYKSQYDAYVLNFIKIASRKCFDDYQFLNSDFIGGYNTGVSNIIADYINIGDEEFLAQINDIITSDNNVYTVSRNLIMGCLRSNNHEIHKLIGDLLLAAKLQEGLRQSIVESMDEANPEAFIYLLKLILDNNLQRFSSISRAFGTWTNLLELDVSRPSVITKCLNLAYECVTDKSAAEKHLESADKMELYIALWSVAFYEVEDVTPLIEKLYDSGVKYKKIVALFFLKSIGFASRQNEFALAHLEEEDFEVFAWLLANMDISSYTQTLRSRWYKNREEKPPLYKPDVAKYVFNTLIDTYKRMKEMSMTFEDSGFHWASITLTKNNILYHMIYAARCSGDVDNVEALTSQLFPMSADTRYFFLRACFDDLSSPVVRRTFLEFLSDQSSDVRDEAKAQFKEKGIDLTESEYLWVEKLLRYKKVDVRKTALDLLMRQDSAALEKSIERLVVAKTLDSRLGGLDLIIKSENDPSLTDVVESSLEIVSKMKVKSPKEKVLVERLLNKDDPEYSSKNGFGLFDPDDNFSIDFPPIPDGDVIGEVFDSVPFERYKKFFTEFNDLVEKYKDKEYKMENWSGEIETQVLGAQRYIYLTKRNLEEDENEFDFLPFSEVWKEFLVGSDLTSEMLYVINFCEQLYPRNLDLGALREFVNQFFPVETIESIVKIKNEFDYYYVIRDVLKYYKMDGYTDFVSDCNYKISNFLLHKIPDKFYNLPREDRNGNIYHDNVAMDNVWLNFPTRNLYFAKLNDEQFEKYFQLVYNYYVKCDYNKKRNYWLMGTEYIARAFELDLISENEMYKELFIRPRSGERISEMSENRIKGKKFAEIYPKSYDLLVKAIDKVVTIESKRGDSPTEVSSLAASIRRYYGMDYFVALLRGLDSKDTLSRGYYYNSSSTTKKNTISNLIKTCYPKEGEGLSEFKKFMKADPVQESILINVAMYAPQWIDIIIGYIGWKGLKSACWYFIAHTQSGIDEGKLATIAKYSPIEKEDFADGAFDVNWFKECYKELGEERFRMVYNSAKYLTSGGNTHRRAQLFADATLGKLDLEESETRISEKRNKDYLLSYGLIPLEKPVKKHTLRRYKFIQEFLKQSKKFGAQRKASEAVVSRIALENLARNAGYSDVIRLTWSMESENIKTMLKYFSPKKVGVYTTYIETLPNNKVSVVVEKDGKRLKSIPTALKKDKYILGLKDAVKDLRDQYRRAVLSLEKAMETEEVFKAKELINLEKNPVIAPAIRSILLKTGDVMGFLVDGFLVDLDGTEHKLTPSQPLTVPHPIHLYESGKWADFQKFVFEKQMVQPFKQIFRELYMPNQDEIDSKISSKRYAGHQLQPRKLSALMKTRGWITGGQKVYYKQNLYAVLYGIPDYFSPSDVEAPTLHSIEFYSRKTHKNLSFDKVPKTVFSEVMRDVDLFVSIAHIGGVDPETSLSTVEMRCAIVREMLPLLRLDNVRVEGSHARIKGSFGEYTVHMGSGVVHKMAHGAVNILAVGSQHRGRIFLPFMDEDPRTAEIVSKIVMLAEDKKIKDPSILEQIR